MNVTLPALVLIFSVMLSSCATGPKILFRQDPLIGQIIQARTGGSVDFDTLMRDAASHQVIYLSEKHDNPMHHEIQHQILQHLTDSERSPIIGFEFFAATDTPLLLNFVESGIPAHSPAMQTRIETELRMRLGFHHQSDAFWAFYYDLLVRARDHGLMVAGLDLSSSQKRRITRKGMAALTNFEKTMIFSTGLSDPAYQVHMKTLLESVHCGMMLSDSRVDRLYETWLARNDAMAHTISRLISEPEKGPVVVIVGTGHTDYGLGVMDRVAALMPGVSQINIALTEIARDPAPLDVYLKPLALSGRDPAPRADYFWFTQRVSYQDPCEGVPASIRPPAGASPE